MKYLVLLGIMLFAPPAFADANAKKDAITDTKAKEEKVQKLAGPIFDACMRHCFGLGFNLVFCQTKCNL